MAHNTNPFRSSTHPFVTASADDPFNLNDRGGAQNFIDDIYYRHVIKPQQPQALAKPVPAPRRAKRPHSTTVYDFSEADKHWTVVRSKVKPCFIRIIGTAVLKHQGELCSAK